MIQVLIAIQPVAMTIWKSAGRYAPLRPKALRVRTICVTPVRCPISTKSAEDRHAQGVAKRQYEHGVPEPEP